MARTGSGKVSRRLSHLDAQGRARMVDVGAKPVTAREAVARGVVRMRPETLALIRGGGIAKGEVLAVARVAGIMAAKRTPEWIPMCHPLPIHVAAIDFRETAADTLEIEARVRVEARTGVEMSIQSKCSDRQRNWHKRPLFATTDVADRQRCAKPP